MGGRMRPRTLGGGGAQYMYRYIYIQFRFVCIHTYAIYIHLSRGSCPMSLSAFVPFYKIPNGLPYTYILYVVGKRKLT